MSAKMKHDLTGMTFGKLYILEETDPYICVSQGTKTRLFEIHTDDLK